MHVISETELLERFKKGDVQAFEAVFKSCYPLLKTEAYLLLDDDEEAEDQVQQLFIDIWNKSLYKNIDVSIRAYLYRSIRHKCLNFLEKKRRHERMVLEYAQTTEEVEPEKRQDELPAHMHQALLELPPQRLAAFNLVYLEEKSYKAAAIEMGISVNSLKTHLKMGLKFLRSSLQRTC
ncbi:RNA polymerase sigma factor [Filimonas effusa]|uniref:Sigma-70 family RNA polymerase sigma factor n=1 Tax=Filimonas effusa TaxID=2508721 RepID=A0A4Q1D8E5_9BACT|nr:sigma-70 family RNA polymerase sigma factor [Filimonas effusa]RXK85604.1 sigma-70 family RNA polymerase sigma factor [Filimonas effusa]